MNICVFSVLIALLSTVVCANIEYSPLSQKGMSIKPLRPIPAGGKPVFQISRPYANINTTLFRVAGFNVEIGTNGRIPSYKYWAELSNATRISFTRIYQQTSSGARGWNINLGAKYNWDISAIYTDATYDNSANSTSHTFNLTGLPSNPADELPKIVFVNHITCNENGTELKFDMHMTEFPLEAWISTAQYLALAYKIANFGVGAQEAEEPVFQQIRFQANATRPSRPMPLPPRITTKPIAIEFGNNNGLEIATTAYDAAGVPVQVLAALQKFPVGVTDVDEGAHVIMFYKRFTGTELHHDPTIYAQNTSSSSNVDLVTLTTYDANGNISPFEFNTGSGNRRLWNAAGMWTMVLFVGALCLVCW